MIRIFGARRPGVAALVVLGLAWISPSPAWAQLGSLIVDITSPASGSTVGGTVPVNATLTIVGGLTVRGVQFRLDGTPLGAEDTTSPYSVPWNTTAASNGSHTLTAVARGLLGLTWNSSPVTVTVNNRPTSGAGDIFISLETGVVQWRSPEGELRGLLESTMGGTTEGLGFDAAGNLYVGRWRADMMGTTGNTVEVFNGAGQSIGRFGQDYDCDPRVTVFDAVGTAYVGEAGCRKAILKFLPGQAEPTPLAAAADNQGIFWMDLGPDDCTMYYTSMGPNVKRYDVCADAQLPDFNVAPLPGGETHDLRVLPDGGVLVSSGAVIARLNAGGVLTRTYQTGHESMWVGLDLVGDGTFWVGGYYTSGVHRFDLESGAVVASFNSGVPSNMVIAVKVKK